MAAISRCVALWATTRTVGFDDLDRSISWLRCQKYAVASPVEQAGAFCEDVVTTKSPRSGIALHCESSAAVCLQGDCVHVLREVPGRRWSLGRPRFRRRLA